MKALVFASRCRKEITRDPLNVFFGLAFPLIILLLLSIIQSNIPDEAQMTLFQPEYLTPGIAMFGLSFISLFSATLISKDRGSSFLMRLYASPMKASDFILGYTLPFLPIALIQTIVCYLAALLLGLEFTPRILLAIAVLLPGNLLFIALGLLCGSVFNDKAVGGICGALLTNLSAWLSGTWFSLDLIGGAFKKIAYCLPFANAVDAGRYALSGDYGAMLPHLCWVIGYAVILLVIAVVVFKRKMKV